MNKFFCQSCQLEFEAEGKKLEYQDRLYGPCWKRVANCPTCDKECDELKPTSSSKSNEEFDTYVQELQKRNGGCCGGGGCCG